MQKKKKYIFEKLVTFQSFEIAQEASFHNFIRLPVTTAIVSLMKWAQHECLRSSNFKTLKGNLLFKSLLLI